MEKKEINRALMISVLLASILLVFSSFKASISSLNLTMPTAAGASSTTGAGKCREDSCPGEKSSPPPPVKCSGSGQMAWPKTGKCVPQNCQKSGFTMVRNAAGNCVPSIAPCEDVGAKRDAKGNCVPKIDIETKSKQGTAGGSGAGTQGGSGAGTQGGSGAGTQGGSGAGTQGGSGANQQGGLTGGASTSGGGSSGTGKVNSGKSTQNSKILSPTERISGQEDFVASDNGSGGAGSSNSAIGNGQSSGLGVIGQGTISGSDSNSSQAGLASKEKEGTATEMISNSNLSKLESAKQQYLSAWDLSEFHSGFDTFIEAGSAKGYGTYNEINSKNVFMPTKTIELYIEPLGFGYKPTIDKEGNILHQINFTANVLVFDKYGNQTGGMSYDIPVIASHNKNTEDYFTIPINKEDIPLSGGEYVIRYFITDESSGETFEITKKIKIAQIILSATAS